MELKACFDILEMPITYDLNAVNQKYHQLIKTCHPDLYDGKGDEQKTIMINLAYREIKKYLTSKVTDNGGVGYNYDVNNDFDVKKEKYDTTFTKEHSSYQTLKEKIENLFKKIYDDYEEFQYNRKTYSDIKKIEKRINLNPDILRHEYMNYKTYKDSSMEYLPWLQIKWLEVEAVKNIYGENKNIIKAIETLKSQYNLYKNDNPTRVLDWISWLKYRIVENDLMSKLLENHSSLNSNYQTYKVDMKIKNQKSLNWLEWLESKCKNVEKNIDNLNLSYKRAVKLYNNYLKNNELHGLKLPLKFSIWLDKKIFEVTVVQKLMINESILLDEYKKYVKHSQNKIDWFEWLEKQYVSYYQLINSLVSSEIQIRKQYDEYCLTMKRQNKKTLDILKWMQYRVDRNNDNIKNLNLTFEEATLEYNSFCSDIKEAKTTLTFEEWLSGKKYTDILINEYYISKKQLFIEYIGNSNIKNWEYWLKNKLKYEERKKYMNYLGLSYEDAVRQYNDYCNMMERNNSFPLSFDDCLRQTYVNNINFRNNSIPR